MPVFLINGHSSLDRVDADTWQDAEVKLGGEGEVIGELVEETEVKAAAALTELKFAQEDGLMKFSGYGAVFNNVDYGGDKILPGAFSETLAQHKSAGTMPAMLLEHGAKAGGPVLPVGVWLSMSEDEYGLKVEGRLADTQTGREAYTLMKMGAMQGLSIGYRPTELGRPSMQDNARRLIKSARLGEVSIVANPMNDKARVLSVKADDVMTIRDLEHLLRDAGYSKSESLRICAKFQAKTSQGEPDGDEAKLAAIHAVDRLIAIMKD
jgi:HK97 family phage prohead protease